MAEKDGLRLSLSLGSGGFGQDQNNPPPPPPVPPFPFNINLIRSGVALPFMLPQNHQFPQPSSSEIRNAAEPRSFFRGIDVNRPATGMDCDDDDVIVSSPNSTVSSLSGKRSAAERELENDPCDEERTSSSLEDDGGDGDGDAAARKKLRLSKEQAVLLEETFKEHNTLNPKQKLALAKELNLRPRQVEVWFQNRRARTKLKQTEVDCEYLKRRCENLTEENRRLQKEVSELRALKLSPQFYMNMSPPTTLTMCPQCEHVAVSSSSSAATSTNNTGIAQPPSVVASSNQQPPPPMPVNPWAAIFSKAKQAPDSGRPRQ